MEAHAIALAEEQEFLKYAKENPGMYAFADVTNHIRTNFPSKLDAKYTKEKDHHPNAYRFRDPSQSTETHSSLNGTHLMISHFQKKTLSS